MIVRKFKTIVHSFRKGRLVLLHPHPLSSTRPKGYYCPRKSYSPFSYPLSTEQQALLRSTIFSRARRKMGCGGVVVWVGLMNAKGDGQEKEKNDPRVSI
jgi:hypothetical protein